jgi:hypothetical protein
MTPVLGQLVLALHLAVIAFNVLGLVAIPLGAWRGWTWVRIRGWRLLHLACWVVVAVQAVLGRACFLTVWQDDLTGGGAGDPMIMRWVNGLIYWDLPMWVFASLYLALFGLVVVLWKVVPPLRK